MCNDTYLTLDAPSEAVYTEKRSKFLAFALPVDTEERAKTELARFLREYHDARHVCYAYVLGADGSHFKSSDNGEPSGTAGKPILGQIRAKGLTDVLVVVVRYFGGIKLGTGGLVVAYKTAARAALDNGTSVERIVKRPVAVVFPYDRLNAVMRVVKELACDIAEQGYSGMDARMVLRIRSSAMPLLEERLGKIDRLRIEKTTTNPD